MTPHQMVLVGALGGFATGCLFTVLMLAVGYWMGRDG